MLDLETERETHAAFKSRHLQLLKVSSLCYRNMTKMGPSLIFITLLLLNCCIQANSITVNCIVTQDKDMTCMWNKDGLSFENYSLYYWYNSDGVKAAAPCAHYLQERGINIGCWFNSSAVRTFSTFNVRLNSSKQEHKQLFRNLQDLVKLEPPVKLHVENTSDLELLLSWEPSRGFRLLCFTYQVKYRSLASDSWTVKNVTSTQFSLPSYSRDKLYTFHVRSKLSDLCASAVLWSEWSVGVSWGRNDTNPRGTAREGLWSDNQKTATLALSPP